ncbi:hypothetical protein GCM10010483_04490 [Actinokineospora diospyrosa]
MARWPTWDEFVENPARHDSEPTNITTATIASLVLGRDQFDDVSEWHRGGEQMRQSTGCAQCTLAPREYRPASVGRSSWR